MEHSTILLVNNNAVKHLLKVILLFFEISQDVLKVVKSQRRYYLPIMNFKSRREEFQFEAGMCMMKSPPRRWKVSLDDDDLWLLKGSTGWNIRGLDETRGRPYCFNTKLLSGIWISIHTPLEVVCNHCTLLFPIYFAGWRLTPWLQTTILWRKFRHSLLANIASFIKWLLSTCYTS